MKDLPEKGPGISLGVLARGAGESVVIDGICDWLVEQALLEPGLGALFSGCAIQLS